MVRKILVVNYGPSRKVLVGLLDSEWPEPPPRLLVDSRVMVFAETQFTVLYDDRSPSGLLEHADSPPVYVPTETTVSGHDSGIEKVSVIDKVSIVKFEKICPGILELSQSLRWVMASPRHRP